MASAGHDRPGETADSLGTSAVDSREESGENMVCTLDLEGRFTSISPSGERLTGWSAAELIGRPATDLIADELRGKAREQFEARLSGAESAGTAETVLVRRSGERVPIEVTSTLIVDGARPIGVLGVVNDLSERRRTAAALAESERRFRRSFESAAIGMALVAPDGRFLDVNSALCEIVGYDADELLQLTFQEITHPDDLELDLASVRGLLEGDSTSYSMEKRYFHRDGQIVWVQLSVSLVTDGDGEPLHFVSQIQDVTARKHAQAALVQSQARLAEAQQTAHIGSWEFDGVSGTVVMSDELKHIYAVPDAAITLDTLIADRVHPLDRDRLIAASQREIDVGDVRELEFRAVLPSGDVRWIYSRTEPLIANGEIAGKRGIAQDITERKASDDRVADAERRYRTLVERLPLGMYVRPLDMSQPNFYASPQVEPMLGYPASDWESDADLLERIVHPDDRARVLGAARTVRATGRPTRDEYRYVARDGSVVWVQDETYFVAGEDGAPDTVQGFLLDITERKTAEAERDRLREQLHDAQKLEALGRLASGVAHDFNNMLTAIRGYSEILVETLDPGAEGHAEAVEIRRAAEQAADLPRQLLAFGRKQELQPQLVDLNEVVEASSVLIRHLITEAVELVTRTSPGHAHAFVDPGHFDQVLVNLALNARDAMPRGGTLTITTRIDEVSATAATAHNVEPGSYVVISVTDTGDGMDEATRDRIFEPYFTTKARGKGTGLGLSGVYGTITQSAGFVWVASEPGSGTTFEINLPLAAVDAQRGHATRRPTILLVEDEDLVRKLAISVLERAGVQVVAAANGHEALRLYDELAGKIDAVVTDVVMPEVGGRELRDQIRRRDGSVPFAFMSGYTDEPIELEEGTAFLAKPFSPRMLVETVRELTGPTDTEQLDAPLARGRLACVVVDDHPAVLDALSRFLATRDFDVVATADAEDALERIEQLQPDVVVLDAGMTPKDGIDIARRVAVVSPASGVVVYTGRREPELLDRALAAGVRGFVIKDAPFEELEDALRTVAAGGRYIDSQTERAPAPEALKSPLTQRELEILNLIAGGLTNERVARELKISPETVQSHVRHAMEKLDANSRTEAVAKALRLALIA